MEKLRTIMAKKSRLCIGLMSGTSMDGVDAALVKVQSNSFETGLDVLGCLTCRYPRGLKKRLLDIVSAGSTELSTLSQMNFLIGELFADAAEAVLEACSVDRGEVDLIGSHGQTIWHSPERRKMYSHRVGSTLQLGEPSVIAARTGIITVADFRMKDVALGGTGAPLIPYFDYRMFRSSRLSTGLLNIGGIANITVLPASCRLEQVRAFDTGPGNMVVDQLMKRLFGREQDDGGRTAEKAFPDRRLLAKMMRHPFIRRQPPKSTGREEFGAPYTEKILAWAEEMDIPREVVISTAAEFTVQSVARNIARFGELRHQLRRLIISGGGTHNRVFMRRLAEVFPATAVETTDTYGIPADYKEAIAFAVFASEAVSGRAVTIPAVTGARSAAISGKIIV